MAKPEEDTRFSKFGTVSFTALTKTNDFIDYLEGDKVEGTKCKKCGAVFFPPRADCYQCLSSDMEWFEISGTGTLLSYTKLQYAPVGFEDDLPYTLALVDYGKYKVFGRLSRDIPEEEITIGMAVVPHVVKLPKGHVSYEFTKA
jgi:uncharacterized OB-fold protein